MIDSKFERCKDPADPNRCQSIGQHGQCWFKALPGLVNCPRHSGRAVSAQIKEAKNQYVVALYQERIENKANHPNLKSVRDEIAIARMTLESLLNRCRTDEELLMRSNSILELVREIGKLVKAGTMIDKESGVTLDKTQAIEWVKEIVTILGTYVADADILTAISEDILDALERRTQK